MQASEAQAVKRQFEQMVQAIQQGRPGQAEALARQTLKTFPNEPNILRVLGVALMRQGKVAEAEKPLETSVKIAPELAAGHEQYGTVLATLGRFEEAERSLIQSLKLNPKAKTVYSKLARVQAMQGRSEDAQKSYARMFELNPRWQKLQDAMDHQGKGENEQAHKIVKEVLRDEPDNVNALHVMGGLLNVDKAHNDAEAVLRRAVELAPDFAVAWSTLAVSLKEQSKYAEAVDCMEKAISLDPMNPEWHHNLGNIYLTSGNEEKALGAFRETLKIRPRHPGALLSLGHVLKTLGDQTEAIEAYRKCADVKPELGEIFWSMANLKTFRFEPDEVALMERQVDSGQIEDESEVNFCYALGKSYEDAKDYDRAFEYYKRGADKKRMMVHYDPVEFTCAVDAIMETMTPELFKKLKGVGLQDPAPILVVGLTRSGSTLIEQILSSHSKVDGTAELPDLQRVAISSGINRSDGLKYPASVMDTPEEIFAELGRDYIESTRRHRQGAEFFTDKMPNNFSHIGFLHLILPNAKVIDARRHPLDSCFGTFKQLFARGQHFSYDLFDLAEYYKNYVRLMDYWDEVLPGKVLRVQYEDVVNDMEGQARRMIAHCGLEWEEQIERFYETERAVKTASSEQVRQPIYKGSLDTWKNYEHHLGDLIEQLEPVLQSMPPHLTRPGS